MQVYSDDPGKPHGSTFLSRYNKSLQFDGGLRNKRKLFITNGNNGVSDIMSVVILGNTTGGEIEFMIKKRTYKKGTIALSQILILILGTIAISYIIGIGQVPVVSADLCTSKCAQGQGNVVPSNCLSDCYSRYLSFDVGGTSCSQTCSGSTVQTLSGMLFGKLHISYSNPTK